MTIPLEVFLHYNTFFSNLPSLIQKHAMDQNTCFTRTKKCFHLLWMLLYAAANLCRDQRRVKYHFGVASSSCIQHNQVRYLKSNCKEKLFFFWRGLCLKNWMDFGAWVNNLHLVIVVWKMLFWWCVFAILRAHHGFGWVGEWANTGWAFDSYKPHFDELFMGIGLLVILLFSSTFWYELCPRDGFRV